MPSITELCLSLVDQFTKGNIFKNKVTREINEAFKELMAHQNASPNQVQTAISAFHPCSTKPHLLKQMQLKEAEGNL